MTYCSSVDRITKTGGSGGWCPLPGAVLLIYIQLITLKINSNYYGHFKNIILSPEIQEYVHFNHKYTPPTPEQLFPQMFTVV